MRNCPTCLNPVSPYWITPAGFADTQPPVGSDSLEAFVRCHACDESYLLVLDVSVYKVTAKKLLSTTFKGAIGSIELEEI